MYKTGKQTAYIAKLYKNWINENINTLKCHFYCRSGKFQCKKLCKAHTSMKLKHTRFLLWKVYFRIISTCIHLPFIAHICNIQGTTCVLYITITCTRLKRALHFIIVLIAKCTGWWCCGSTPKDELPDPRGSLANNIPSRAVEQANQEVWQDDCHSQHASSA